MPSTRRITAQWVGNMSSAGDQGFTFHIEATEDPIGCIRKSKKLKRKCCALIDSKILCTGI